MSLPTIASIQRRIERLEAARPPSFQTVILMRLERTLRMDEDPRPDDVMHAEGMKSEPGETPGRFAERVARHRGLPAHNVHAVLIHGVAPHHAEPV